MAKKLLQTSLGWLSASDRDSYLNKRIELTGTLLNNLYRNYFNKLVKDMQKQIVREINNGSWKSTEDYLSIINSTCGEKGEVSDVLQKKNLAKVIFFIAPVKAHM